MPLYAWVKPAFVKGAPVDHTWVTTYDSVQVQHATLQDVVKAKEHYWFCRGLFHPHGVSNSHPHGRILEVPFDANSLCLVRPDSEKEGGTVHVYGIHGVCHQVSNQVLYPSGRNVSSARGYKLSSAIFGSFGVRWLAWQQQKIQCQINIITAQRRALGKSLLFRRAQYAFGDQSPLPMQLEVLTLAVRTDIETIGFAVRGPDETVVQRVEKLNARIMTFLRDVADVVPDGQFFQSALGYKANDEVNLIDPELFVFPDPNDRP